MAFIADDLIIAHNLATLYPAYVYSKKHKIPFAFDIEDYHPGEVIHSDSINEKIRREFLMSQLLPETKYFTYASPLIGEHSLRLIPNNKSEHFLINNCFSELDFTEPKNEKTNNFITFVWFSQNITYNRGLELIIPALKKFKNRVKLHLIGI